MLKVRLSGIPTPNNSGRTLNDLMLGHRCSRLVYRDVWDAESDNLGRWGFHKWKYIDRDGQQAFVATNDKQTVVVFAGTDPKEWKDWKRDFMARKTSLYYWGHTTGAVHRGCELALRAVYSDVVRAYRDFNKKPNSTHSRVKQLKVFGHSLAGGIANLFAAVYPHHKICITYGSMRVGNATFARWCDRHCNIIRVQNHLDPVPHLPTFLPLPFGSYRHTKSVIFIDRNGNLILNPGLCFRAKNVVAALVLGIDKFARKGLPCHHIGYYGNRIDTYLARAGGNLLFGGET